MALLPFLLLALSVPALSITNVPVTNHWAGGFQGEACVPITTELNGWKAHLAFSEDVDSIEIWVADATKLSPREFLLENKMYDAQQHVGDKLCFTFLAKTTGDISPQVTVYIEGMDGPAGATNPPNTHTSAPHTGGGSAKKDYGDALGKSILFYDAQRSGKLPANNPIPWRGDSALNDCVPGGWYDAGDHVKFGLPMSSSSTLLLWSLIKFKDAYVRAGQLDNMYDMIKWPLDYFLKAWDSAKQELVVQVGDGNLDHQFWGRPEDMTMNRPCLVVSSRAKGSDIAGGTTAALAAGAIAFKDKGDTDYSNRLLTAARSLYSFATANRGIFNGAAGFYTSSGDKDELCEASVWLYRATQNNQYLNDAKSYADLNVPWTLSWDNKYASCLELLYEETKDSTYRNVLVNYFNQWLPGGNVAYTPCGLAWRGKWGSLREMSNTAFLALLAAENGLDASRLRKWAVEQINFILGDNNHDGGCFSYQIGYGTKYPRHPHHRASSCPNMPAPCGYNEYNSPGPNPQILQGALVGGPQVDDSYEDRRDDYVLNEVATDYNSGFQGALAGIVHLQSINSLPATNNKCPCLA